MANTNANVNIDLLGDEFGTFVLGKLFTDFDQLQDEDLDLEKLFTADTEPDDTMQPPETVSERQNSKKPTFIEVSEREKQSFVDTMKNKNTARKTESSIKLFKTWLSKEPRFETRDPSEIPPTELDNYIGSFILSVRKADGSDYEPDTLTSHHRSIDRYLRDKKYPVSIVIDKEFWSSRTVLASKRKELKQKGKGNRPNAAEPITEKEEAILREKGCMGNESPRMLLNKVWYNNTVLFGLRGGAENHNLRWGDIALKNDEEGREYLEFNERDTKTRTGESSTHRRAFHPKQFAHINPETCPVQTYKDYASHRPDSMNFPEAPFYLSVNNTRRPGSALWYKKTPLGENSLRKIMKEMADKAGLPGKKTNHSARKTTCTKLLHAGVAPTTIQQLTGHRNVQSVNNYAAASVDMQREMCGILSNERPCILSATRPIAKRPSSSISSSPDHRADVHVKNRVKSDHSSTGQILQNCQLLNCNITIHQISPASAPKRRRIRVIDSDSD